MTKEELEQEINSQRKENIRLYEIFQYKEYKEEMQPLLNAWRLGSKRIKQLSEELNELLEKQKPATVTTNKPVEKTERYITCATYENAQRRMAKEMMSFIGG